MNGNRILGYGFEIHRLAEGVNAFTDKNSNESGTYNICINVKPLSTIFFRKSLTFFPKVSLDVLQFSFKYTKEHSALLNKLKLRLEELNSVKKVVY